MLKFVINQHWFGVVLLLPAIAMIAAHEVLGLSNDLMGHLVGTPEPTTLELLFNYAMVFAFYCGVAGFLAHAFQLAKRSYFWLTVKLVGLACGWYLLLLWLSSPGSS